MLAGVVLREEAQNHIGVHEKRFTAAAFRMASERHAGGGRRPAGESQIRRHSIDATARRGSGHQGKRLRRVPMGMNDARSSMPVMDWKDVSTPAS